MTADDGGADRLAAVLVTMTKGAEAMGKHAYAVGCECKRCVREAARRDGQSRSSLPSRAAAVRAGMGRARSTSSRRPAVGSQEWAETRGDDLGESPDY